MPLGGYPLEDSPDAVEVWIGIAAGSIGSCLEYRPFCLPACQVADSKPGLSLDLGRGGVFAIDGDLRHPTLPPIRIY